MGSVVSVLWIEWLEDLSLQLKDLEGERPSVLSDRVLVACWLLCTYPTQVETTEITSTIGITLPKVPQCLSELLFVVKEKYQLI